MVADTPRTFRIGFGEAAHGFANNLEVALNGLTKSPVGSVSFQGLVMGDLPNKSSSIPNVIEEFWRLRLYREASGCVPVRVGSEDF